MINSRLPDLLGLEAGSGAAACCCTKRCAEGLAAPCPEPAPFPPASAGDGVWSARVTCTRLAAGICAGVQQHCRRRRRIRGSIGRSCSVGSGVAAGPGKSRGGGICKRLPTADSAGIQRQRRRRRRIGGSSAHGHPAGAGGSLPAARFSCGTAWAEPAETAFPRCRSADFRGYCRSRSACTKSASVTTAASVMDSLSPGAPVSHHRGKIQI